MEEDNRHFAAAHAGGLAVVRSSFRDVNHARLRTLTPEIKNWWVDVQFAMAFTSLTAPVLYQHGIPLLHIASGYSDSYTGSHGSLPRLDNLISLGHAGVHHDGAELTRQEKLQEIVRRTGQRPVQLRVCHANRRYEGRNCGDCGKCLRTIVGLVVAGGDPAAYGFPQVTAETISMLPRRFAAGEIPFSQWEPLMWRDIQVKIEADTQDPFLAWLQGMDFQRYLETQKQRVLRRSRYNRLAARVPRVYTFARRARRLLP
jgi:hypothetical protein